jgi:hypothetical protein
VQEQDWGKTGAGLEEGQGQGGSKVAGRAEARLKKGRSKDGGREGARLRAVARLEEGQAQSGGKTGARTVGTRFEQGGS